MKKTTILAFAMVLAAAILAVWLTRENPSTEQVAARNVDSPPGPHTAPSASVPETSIGPAPDVPVAVAIPPAQSSSEPVQLFSTPDYGSIRYRDATIRAAQYVGNIRDPVVIRSRLLERNEAALNGFLRQLDANDESLGTSFQITPFDDLPCTVSRIRYKSPEFAGGTVAPRRYMVEARCDESPASLQVTIHIDRDREGVFTFGFRSAPFGGFAIKTFDDSGYMVAYQLDDTR